VVQVAWVDAVDRSSDDDVQGVGFSLAITEMGKTMEQFVKIAVLENAIETQLVESVLKERQIPHRIRSYHDTAYDGLFQVQKGWAELNAPSDYRNEILDILNSVRNHSDQPRPS
jgi:hypothetical protein